MCDPIKVDGGFLTIQCWVEHSTLAPGGMADHRLTPVNASAGIWTLFATVKADPELDYATTGGGWPPKGQVLKPSRRAHRRNKPTRQLRGAVSSRLTSPSKPPVTADLRMEFTVKGSQPWSPVYVMQRPPSHTITLR